MASGERGIKKGLRGRHHSIILMLDEVIITETPPLTSCYHRRGHPRWTPISGNRAKRIIHGVINIKTGEMELLITSDWVQETHQAFLHLIDVHWRGWNIIVFQDRGSPHTAEESLRIAAALQIEVRFLPRATPELNAMDHLWRWVKSRGIANEPTRSVDDSADQACRYLLNLSPQERLRKAGILSGNFWLIR